MGITKLKKIYGYKFILLQLIALGIVTAQTEARQMVRNTYEGECQNMDPLTTYDRCDNYSVIGRAAIRCAEEEALGLCRAGFNSECIVSATRAYSVYSRDFIGYRKCIGKARVHGYEPR